ncbi:MAG: PD-(D/E)XK nuclease family protein [Candidatus Methanofastidiosia archaeon]
MREPRIFSRRVRHPLSELAEVAKRYYLSYKNPHERVENFLLRNEKRTIAIEVPVWFLTDEPFSGLTGHIDILRLTDRIEIWDYKPQADRKKFASSQLFWYAQMLARRLELEIENFRCFYFDEKKTYFFEF